jgi:hypothetical protein
MGTIITLADVKDQVLLRRNDLQDLIDDANAAIEARCNRIFSQTTFTEIHDGQNLSRVWLRNPPILSVTSITIDGQDVDNTFGDSWCFRSGSGELVRGNGQDDPRFAATFPRGNQNVSVVYEGGYSPMNGAVRRAALILVKHLALSTRVTGMYRSESFGDYSYTIGEPASVAFPPLAADLLADFIL